MLRVLIVEDNDDVRSAIVALLRFAGFGVISFACAETAASDGQAHQVEVALLDVRMPGRTGDAYAADLLLLNPDIRIIFITGEADIDRLKKVVPTSRVLRKPVDADLLVDLLHGL